MKTDALNSFIIATAMLGLSACSFSESLPEDRVSDQGIYEEFFTQQTFTPVKTAKKAKKKTFKDNESYEVSSVSDATLSQMRGGFISASGLRIDFGIYSATTVNNSLVSSLSYSTSGFNTTNLQQLLQTGSGNQASVTSTSVPMNVLTVVQNTADNQVIQNVNVLDITVSNMAAFRNQQIGNNMRFITIGR